MYHLSQASADQIRSGPDRTNKFSIASDRTTPEPTSFKNLGPAQDQRIFENLRQIIIRIETCDMRRISRIFDLRNICIQTLDILFDFCSNF